MAPENRDSEPSQVERTIVPERFAPNEEEIVQLRPTYDVPSSFAFGDGGTYAHVGPLGSLLQLNRYLPKRSAVIAIEMAETVGWSDVFSNTNDRVKKFKEIICDRDTTGLGLFITEERFLASERRLKWLFNRWPQVSYLTNGVFVTIRFIVKEGRIIQQYLISNPTEQEVDIPFNFNLDFAVRSHSKLYEDEPFTINNYVIQTDTQGNVMLKCPIENTGLQFSLYIDASKISVDPSSSRQYQFSQKILSKTSKELIAVYEIQDLEDQLNASTPTEFSLPYISVDDFLFAARNLLTAENLTPDQVKSHNQWHKENSWEWPLLYRHSEHILSVCMIPIHTKNKVEGDMKSGVEETIKVDGLAFADAYLARTSISAFTSFFAFHFLLMMYSFIEENPVLLGNSRRRHQARIKDACTRHLTWTFEIAQLSEEQGWFEEYLSNGSPRPGQPKPSFTAGSLNYLKLINFLDVFPNQSTQTAKWIKQRTLPWLNSLISTRHKKELWFDKTVSLEIEFRGLAFRPRERLNAPRYNLTRLVILWMALERIKELLNDKEKIEIMNADLSRDLTAKLRELDTNSLKKKIFSAFIIDIDQAVDGIAVSKETVEIDRAMEQLDSSIEKLSNPFSPQSNNNHRNIEKRLALVRTVDSHKTRQFFYSIDVFLFDAANLGFFHEDRENYHDVWRQSVEQQIGYMADSMKDAELTKPAYDALILAIAEYCKAHNFVLPTGPETVGLTNNFRARLRGSMLDSGIMASWVEEASRRPIYYSLETLGPFLIPSLLLWDKSKQSGIFCMRNKGKKIAVDNLSSKESSPIDTTTKYSDQSRFDRTINKPIGLSKKKLGTGSSKVDRKNINDGREFSSDWLYDYPTFFHRKPLTYNDSVIMRDLDVPVFQEASQRWKFMNEEEKKNVTNDRSANKESPVNPWKDRIVLVIDVSTKVNRRSIVRGGTVMGKDLEAKLKAPRVPSGAKKRFIFLENCSPIDSFRVCLTTPGDDSQGRKRLVEYFQNHSKWINFHEEWIHRLGNLWESEFHLAFFQVVQGEEINKSHETGIMKLHKRVFPGSIHGTKSYIIQTGAGYRFQGDLYDRFWTCYFASLLVHEEEFKWITKDGAEHEFWLSEKDRQDQRRVLELYLTEKMTDAASQSGEHILKMVENTLRSSGTLDRTNPEDEDFEARYSRSTIILQISEFLHEMEDKYQEMLGTIARWERRQADRSAQPRWTEKDEQRCRDKIEWHDSRVRWNINVLKEQKAKLDSLLRFAQNKRSTLLSDLQLEEARRSTRLSQDVRLFTYVTIVFLPLSFSSSLFSMGGSPDNSTVRTMVATTFISLTLTFVLLANMKLLDRHARITYHRVEDATRKMMDRSSLKWPVDWKQKAEALEMEQKRTLQYQDNDKSQTSWWIVWFLIASLCVAPSKAISTAVASVIVGGKELHLPLHRRAFHVLVAVFCIPFWIFISVCQTFLELFSMIRWKVSTEVLKERDDSNTTTDEVASYEEAKKVAKKESDIETAAPTKDNDEAREKYEKIRNDTFDNITSPTRTIFRLTKALWNHTQKQPNNKTDVEAQKKESVLVGNSDDFYVHVSSNTE